MVETIETACLQSGNYKCMEALGRAWGGVWDCLMGMHADQPWAASREEFKRCFSDLTPLGHAAGMHS